MDTRTGEIFRTGKDLAEAMRRDKRLAEFARPMALPPTAAQARRRPPRVGRNEPCPCGSGRKFKRCCLRLGR